MWVWIVVLAVGCGGASPPPSGHASGSRLARARAEIGLPAGDEEEDEEDNEEEDEEERPTELGPEHLPLLPRGVEPDGEPLAAGWAATGVALGPPCPVPDPSLDGAAFQRWVEGEYAAWLRARGEALAAARRALAPAEQGEVGDYVVASALVGLLFARLAGAIDAVPLPGAIQADQGTRLRFRDAFLRTSTPLRERAIGAFGACASAAARAADRRLGGWQRFCDEELSAAQEAPRPL